MATPIRLAERAVLFAVTLHAPEMRRKVPSGKVDTNADKRLVHVSKDILESEEVDAIFRLDRKYKVWVRDKRAFPSLVKDSVFVLPLALVPDVDRETARFVREREALADAAAEAYPGRVRASMRSLKDLANTKDYPSQQEFRSAFSVDVVYLSFGVPETLPVGVRSRETDRSERLWAEAGEEIRYALREGMAELVESMADRLQEGPGRRPKAFANSAGTRLARLNEFFEVFEKRNIMDDAALADLVGKAKELTKGVSPGALRDNARLRDRVRKGFEEVKGALDGMLVDRPARRMRLGEEE